MKIEKNVNKTIRLTWNINEIKNRYLILKLNSTDLICLDWKIINISGAA